MLLTKIFSVFWIEKQAKQTVQQNNDNKITFYLKNTKSEQLLLLLKNVSSARLGESDIHPISPKTHPSPTIPTYRQKEEKGKESRRL